MVDLSRQQVSEWFAKHEGKQISPIEEPLDRPEHCDLRIKWVINYYGLLTNPYAPICYIYEK